jgi:small GTP-binding protein
VGFENGGNMRLHIWDTGGSEKYKTMTSLYYRGAHAALVVYSVSDDNSFQALDDWLTQLEENGTSEKTIKIIVGNKSDVSKHERRITP